MSGRETDAWAGQPTRVRTTYYVAPTVSLYELQHNVPGKAIKAYKKAHDWANKGNSEQAIEHLRQAIAADPGFVDAKVDLAALHIKRNEASLALPELEAALKYDPNCGPAYSNLAIAYMMEDRNSDAEVVARRLNDVDRGSNMSRFILALALVQQGKYSEETASLLKRSAEDVPQARLLLGRVLAAQGHVGEARETVERYLETSSGEGRNLAEEWLVTLRGAQETATVLR